MGTAQACLLNPQKKTAYDARLRQQSPSEAMAAQGPPEAPPEAPPKTPAVGLPKEKSPDSGLAALPQKAGGHFAAVRSRFAGKKPPRKLWIGTGAAAAALVLLFGVVFYVTTNKGTIKITLSDPKADVQIKVDGDSIEVAALGEKLRLRPGEHELVVTAEGYESVCRSFTVRRGDNPVLAVTLVARPVAGGQAAEQKGRTVENPKRAGAQTTVETATPPVKPSVRYLGYMVHQQPSCLKEFASYTNVVVDRGWPDYGDAMIKVAREAGVKVVLDFYMND